jgi:hypothetical protein
MKRRVAILSMLGVGLAIPIMLVGCGQAPPEPAASMPSAEKQKKIDALRKDPSIPASQKEAMIKSLQGSSR